MHYRVIPPFAVAKRGKSRNLFPPTIGTSRFCYPPAAGHAHQLVNTPKAERGRKDRGCPSLRNRKFLNHPGQVFLEMPDKSCRHDDTEKLLFLGNLLADQNEIEPQWKNAADLPAETANRDDKIQAHGGQALSAHAKRLRAGGDIFGCRLPQSTPAIPGHPFALQMEMHMGEQPFCVHSHGRSPAASILLRKTEQRTAPRPRSSL